MHYFFVIINAYTLVYIYVHASVYVCDGCQTSSTLHHLALPLYKFQRQNIPIFSSVNLLLVLHCGIKSLRLNGKQRPTKPTTPKQPFHIHS